MGTEIHVDEASECSSVCRPLMSAANWSESSLEYSVVSDR